MLKFCLLFFLCTSALAFPTNQDDVERGTKRPFPQLEKGGSDEAESSVLRNSNYPHHSQSGTSRRTRNVNYDAAQVDKEMRELHALSYYSDSREMSEAMEKIFVLKEFGDEATVRKAILEARQTKINIDGSIDTIMADLLFKTKHLTADLKQIQSAVDDARKAVKGPPNHEDERTMNKMLVSLLTKRSFHEISAKWNRLQLVTGHVNAEMALLRQAGLQIYDYNARVWELLPPELRIPWEYTIQILTARRKIKAAQMGSDIDLAKELAPLLTKNGMTADQVANIVQESRWNVMVVLAFQQNKMAALSCLLYNAGSYSYEHIGSLVGALVNDNNIKALELLVEFGAFSLDQLATGINMAYEMMQMTRREASRVLLKDERLNADRAFLTAFVTKSARAFIGLLDRDEIGRSLPTSLFKPEGRRMLSFHFRSEKYQVEHNQAFVHYIDNDKIDVLEFLVQFLGADKVEELAKGIEHAIQKRKKDALKTLLKHEHANGDVALLYALGAKCRPCFDVIQESGRVSKSFMDFLCRPEAADFLEEHFSQQDANNNK